MWFPCWSKGKSPGRLWGKDVQVRTVCQAWGTPTSWKWGILDSWALSRPLWQVRRAQLLCITSSRMAAVIEEGQSAVASESFAVFVGLPICGAEMEPGLCSRQAFCTATSSAREAWVSHLHVCVYTICVPGAWRNQKRVSLLATFVWLCRHNDKGLIGT